MQCIRIELNIVNYAIGAWLSTCFACSAFVVDCTCDAKWNTGRSGCRNGYILICSWRFLKCENISALPQSYIVKCPSRFDTGWFYSFQIFVNSYFPANSFQCILRTISRFSIWTDFLYYCKLLCQVAPSMTSWLKHLLNHCQTMYRLLTLVTLLQLC